MVSDVADLSLLERRKERKSVHSEPKLTRIIDRLTEYITGMIVIPKWTTTVVTVKHPDTR